MEQQTMESGTVKWFDTKKKYGFIRNENLDEDVFVHASNVEETANGALQEGDRVVFTIENTEKGPAAAQVKPLRENGEETSRKEKTDEREQETEDAPENESRETATPETTKTFGDLGLVEPVLSGTKRAGFDAPRPVQEKTIPSLLDGRDLVCSAPTGTGKTAAFLLPMLQHFLTSEDSPDGPRGLVLAPTHELADQITEEGRVLAGDEDIRIDSVYGGTDIHNEMLSLREGVDLLVACPGRLIDHLYRKNLSLENVEIFVLDEADRLCDMGFLPQIKQVRQRLTDPRQDLFFSATIPDKIQNLANSMMEDPVRVSVGQRKPRETISHYVVEVNKNQKYNALTSILDEEDTDSVLVFCRTRNTVRNLTKKLRGNRYEACGLQGGMDDVARDATLSAFRDQRFKILVATNVAARGLDVEHISHVINYDVPEEPDVYTHRLGRTGRADMTGEAWTLSTPKNKQDLREIEQAIGDKIERRSV